MKLIDTDKKVKGISQKKAPLFVAIKTKKGNLVSMRNITASEAKATRNSAYKYLA